MQKIPRKRALCCLVLYACFAAFVHALLSSSCAVQETPLVDLEDYNGLEGVRPLPMMFMYCLPPA